MDASHGRAPRSNGIVEVASLTKEEKKNHGILLLEGLDVSTSSTDFQGEEDDRFVDDDEDIDDDDSTGCCAGGVASQLKKSTKGFLEVTGLMDIRRLVPIITWLPSYNKEKFIGDMVAGLTVGLMVIPQGMAYANLAGLPPAFGLYSSFMGCIVYAVFGTAKDVSVGPTALMSLIVSESFSELPEPHFDNPCSAVVDENFCCDDGGEFLCTPVPLAVAATLISGLYQIGMGVLNFGFIVDYIGFPVLNGFTTAAAVTIFTSQIRHILGLQNIDRHWVKTVPDLITNLGDSRWQDAVMGLSCMALTYYLERLKVKYNDRRGLSRKDYTLWLCGTARNAIVVILAAIVARIVGATSAGDEAFRLVGDVPAGLPKPSNPLTGLGDGMSEVITASIAISLLGYLESIAIGKAFAHKNGYELDPTQEMRAIGLGNVVSSFFQSYAITGSFSRTAVNAASNVQTAFGGVFTALLVIVSLEAVTAAFFWIPKAALGAIIMMSVVHMVDVDQVRRIGKVQPQDLLIWFTSFLACLLWSLEFGILLAIGVSAILMLYNSSAQKMVRLKRNDALGVWREDLKYTTSGLPSRWGPEFVKDLSDRALVIKCMGFFDFAMTNSFRDRMTTISHYFQSESEVRAVVIDMSAITSIDYTGILALEYALDTLKPGIHKIRTPVEGTGGANGKKKFETVSRQYMGVRVYAANIPKAILAPLRKAGLFGGDVRLGEWKLQHQHSTIDRCFDAMNDDFTRVAALYPFPWQSPKDKAVLTTEGTTCVGQDGAQWTCTATKPKGKGLQWARSPESVSFKLSVL
eukprot:m.1228508 g.1228508  ORF g.1228508 m.1228508 type:complete len:802 (+) comp24645_c0_seq1:166-2571(+)